MTNFNRLMFEIQMITPILTIIGDQELATMLNDCSELVKAIKAETKARKSPRKLDRPTTTPERS